MTIIIDKIASWQDLRHAWPATVTIGFVPTMGNLHIGHLSLLQKARAENEIVVLSIFVNPTQFNNQDDYQQYPRTINEDINLANEAQVDYILIPSADEIYLDNYAYQIIEQKFSLGMEGKARPGHFSGMLTIVMKLLQLVRANKAYFGDKDYQQLHLVNGLCKAFFMDTDIISCPIIREESGLPYSSRNNRLTTVQREQAKLFPKFFHQNKPCTEVCNDLLENGFIVEYIEEHAGRRFAAIQVGEIRLIDNFDLNDLPLLITNKEDTNK